MCFIFPAIWILLLPIVDLALAATRTFPSTTSLATVSLPWQESALVRSTAQLIFLANEAQSVLATALASAATT